MEFCWGFGLFQMKELQEFRGKGESSTEHFQCEEILLLCYNQGFLFVVMASLGQTRMLRPR
jgi:hypothetical protein